MDAAVLGLVPTNLPIKAGLSKPSAFGRAQSAGGASCDAAPSAFRGVLGELLRGALNMADRATTAGEQKSGLGGVTEELLNRLLAEGGISREELVALLKDKFEGLDEDGTGLAAMLAQWLADPEAGAEVEQKPQFFATPAEPSKVLNIMRVRLERMIAAADAATSAEEVGAAGRIARTLGAATASSKADASSASDLVYMADTWGEAGGTALGHAPGMRRFAGVDAAMVEGFRRTLGRMREAGAGGAASSESSLFSPDAPVASLTSALAGIAPTGGSAPGPALPPALSANEANPSFLLDPVSQARAVLADMAEQLQGGVALDSERMRAVLHLDPPVLGRVQIQLSVDDTQRVVALLHAENSETQDFLQQNQSELRQGLARQGFDPDRIDLAFDPEQARAFDALLNTEPAPSRSARPYPFA